MPWCCRARKFYQLFILDSPRWCCLVVRRWFVIILLSFSLLILIFLNLLSLLSCPTYVLPWLLLPSSVALNLDLFVFYCCSVAVAAANLFTNDCLFLLSSLAVHCCHITIGANIWKQFRIMNKGSILCKSENWRPRSLAEVTMIFDHVFQSRVLER